MHGVERNLSEARLSELIELALSDKVSFKAIKNEFGLKEIEVKICPLQKRLIEARDRASSDLF